jgi:hypothetical protein
MKRADCEIRIVFENYITSIDKCHLVGLTRRFLLDCHFCSRPFDRLECDPRAMLPHQFDSVSYGSVMKFHPSSTGEQNAA